MDFNGLWLEYALEGSSNYISWKYRMEAMLEDTGLKEFIDSDVPKPTSMDVVLLMAKESSKDEKDSFGRCMRPHCLKPSWEIHSICYVEGFDGSFPKQQRP